MTVLASVPLGKRPCDCLDICGDDPAVRTGRAAVCQAKIARDREMAEISERMDLQRELAEQAAIECLRFGAQVRPIDGSDWLDISGDIERLILTEDPVPPAISALARAARYLVLTKRAEQHPTHLYVLRMLPPGGRRSTDRPSATPT